MKWPRPWRTVLLGLALGAVGCCAANAAPPSWPDTFTARLEALALLQTLNADLLSHDSATATLQRWCESHQLAPHPHITASQVHAWPAIGRFLITLSVTGLTGLLAALAAVLLAGAFTTIRRVTV